MLGRGGKRTTAAKVAQSNWQEDESMGSSENHQGQPHTEVVNLEDLAPSKGQNANTQELGDGDATEDASTNVDQGRPCPSILAAEFGGHFLHDGPSWEHESSSNVSAELNTNAHANDQIDKRHGIQ